MLCCLFYHEKSHKRYFMIKNICCSSIFKNYDSDATQQEAKENIFFKKLTCIRRTDGDEYSVWYTEVYSR